MNITYRNHYLSQFYLNSFVNKANDEGFWVYYKKGGEPKLQTPINTGIEKHLYNIKRANGSVDDSVEKELLAPIETVVSPIIKKLLLSNARLEEDDIPKLGLFMAFMATRIPRTIESVRELGEAFSSFLVQELSKKPDRIKESLDWLKKEGKLDKDYTVEEMQDIMRDADKKFKVSMNKKYATGMSLLSTIGVFEELLTMNWCLCRAPSDSFFITSDCPVVCFVKNEDDTAIIGGGFGLSNAEVSFPLSPNKCLFMDRKHNQKYRAANKKFVLEINRRTAWAADIFILSHVRSQYTKILIEKSSVTLELPKMDRNKLFEEFEKRKIFE